MGDHEYTRLDRVGINVFRGRADSCAAGDGQDMLPAPTREGPGLLGRAGGYI